MVRKILIQGAMLCSLISLAQISQKGLVAYYPFSGNALDNSGNGNDGTVYSATLTTDKFNDADKAYSFNGTSSYINIGQKSSLKMTDSISISAWFYVNTISPTYQNIISDHGLNQATAGPGKILRLNYGKLQFIVGGLYGSTVTPATYVESSITVSKWYHVVATYDRSLIKLYVNNVLVATKAYSQSLTVNPNNILIGNSGFGNEFFNGKMDQIRIYKRAITENEVKALYEEGAKPVITAKGKTNLCKGGLVVLDATKGLSGYTWSNGTKDVDMITVTKSGSYFVVVNGKDTSNTIEVSIDTNVATIESFGEFINTDEKPITLIGEPSGGVFSGNGVTNGTMFNPKVAGLGTSLISYTYQSPSGCTSKATRKVIVYDTLSSSCSVKDTLFIRTVLGLGADKENTIKIYPNPASTSLEINNGDYLLMSSFNVEILNPTGQVVFTSAINQEHFSINITSWAKNGIYLLRLFNSQNETVETRKIVLE